MNYVEALAEIYQGLAEALASPPAAWLAVPGREWPLWQAAVSLAAHSVGEAWQQAVLKMAEVPADALAARREAYRQICRLPARPPLALYECQYADGRFPGPATFTVKRLYAQAGLEVEGAEMPDHVSVELAFLAYLCQQEARGGAEAADWRTARRLFIKQHAGKWLPQVGRTLAHSSFPAWEAVGMLLAASLEPVRLRKSAQASETAKVYPQIAVVEDCNLCGFCVQVCPTQALRIREDESQTELWLLPEKCVSCHKCERVCETDALTLAGEAYHAPRVLRSSPRAHCPRCGAPTVSQAELSAVAAMLGEHPDWLDTCLNCR